MSVLSAPMPPIFITLLGTWLAWYCGKFHLLPRIYPDEPREYPYYIPIIGHVVPFFKDHDALYTRARKYFGDTREPFRMTIMGQTTYVVTSAADVSAIFKSPKTLSIEPFIHGIMMSFGLPKRIVDAMFEKGFAPGDKSYMDVSHNQIKMQLHPGEKLNVLQDKMLGRTDELMQWNNLKGRMVLSNDVQAARETSKEAPKTVSLFKWAQDFIVDATTRSLWDGRLYDLAPDLLPQFWIFEDECWLLPFQLPRFAAKRLHNAKDYLEGALSAYLRLPEHELNESWLLRQVDRNLEQLGMEHEHRGRTTFTLFRTANANAYKSSFWMLAYILFDSNLTLDVRNEIKPAFDSKGRLDMEVLLNSCPLMNSLYDETVRVFNSPLGVRTVMEPTVIGGKRLAKGKTLFMVYRQLHYDPAVWGDDAKEFKARRFVENPELAKSTSYRPFGGAVSWCPGRFLARREVLLFVATALHRFNIEVVAEPGQQIKFPRPDDGLPTGGMYAPRKGDDVMLKVTPANFFY